MSQEAIDMCISVLGDIIRVGDIIKIRNIQLELQNDWRYALALNGKGFPVFNSRYQDRFALVVSIHKGGENFYEIHAKISRTSYVSDLGKEYNPDDFYYSDYGYCYECKPLGTPQMFYRTLYDPGIDIPEGVEAVPDYFEKT